MVLGVNPQQLMEMQKVSKDIKGVIKINFKENTVQLFLSSDVPDAQALIPQLLEQFSGALAQQLSSFFAIKGELIETGKEPSGEEETSQT